MFGFFFFCKSIKYEREIQVSREDKETERSEFNTGLNFHAYLLFPAGGGQSHRKEQTPIAYFRGCSTRSLKTHYKCILPACQHHKGETLSINSTRSREAFLFPLAFFFSLYLSDCLSFAPLSLPPSLSLSVCLSLSNIINMVHPCQSKT